MSEPHSGSCVSGPCALVVDDDNAMAFMVQDMLELMGVEADIARDGRAAVDMASAKAYALILMDIEMPEMDGFDATKAIRAQVSTDVPIVGMTGHLMDAIHRLGKIAGMDDLITKPFMAGALCAKLKAVCGDRVALADI